MDFINIIGTLFDNSIEHVVAFAKQIKDQRLNKNQQDINEDLENSIRDFEQSNININKDLESFGTKLFNLQRLISQIENSNENIQNKLQNIEQQQENINNKDSIIHRLISQKDYNNLTSYEKNTLYIILENFENSHSVFGDTFPFILGGKSSLFGDTFPFILN